MQTVRPLYASIVSGVALMLAIAVLRAPLAAAPIIGCPPGIIDVSAGKFEEVKIELVVEGADSVYIADGAWKNNEFTFVATRSGPRDFIICAWSGPDTISCLVRVNVVLNGSPIISAAPETERREIIGPETDQICQTQTENRESEAETPEPLNQDR